ncbi:MAG TPA: gamma-glutamyl-gamma-aminobutyrate hydrolase family protein [Polyangiaceae bacterium]|jgi:GMP synthase (glutamine-hydrolysing)
MKVAIVLQHEDFEGPARIGDLLAARGYAIELRAVHRGDAVPERMNAEDLLVVMGGSMGVGEADRAAYAFLDAELRLLGRRIEEDAPVLGICLGAQLLAHAAGARVYPMTDGRDGARVYEVGWGPIRFRTGETDAETDDALVGLPPEAHVLHWHGDTFDLPAGATLLASSAICPHQAFRLKRRLFGLQFHCEVDADHVDVFLRGDADYVIRANGPDGVARLRRDTARHAEESGRLADVLLGNIVRAMALPA